MENNNPKKSKAFIITFILILLLLIAGYYFFKNREQIFGTQGSTSENKQFWPLLFPSRNKPLKVIEDPNAKIVTPTDNSKIDTTTPKRTGTVITDTTGNRLVLAEAGEILKKGDVLYIAGFNKNNQPIVMKAIASDKSKALVFGVAGEDMLKGALGNIIIEGILSGVPTNRKEGTLWMANNPLYLSDKIYGGMTKNPPITPSLVVPVGSVIKVDAKNGSIRIGIIANKTTSQLYSSSVGDMRDYWDSVFGNDLFSEFKNIEPTGFGTPPLNPITPPPSSSWPSSTSPTSSGLPTNNTSNNGECADKTKINPPACDKDIPKVEPNKCLVIEQNPLTFTPEEKARLAVLLRKFYLVSSTLKTADDITTIYNEIDQQKNFISQIEELTGQCYAQITDEKMTANKWVRHGNPWYTKTAGGTFPYTSGTTGYTDNALLQNDSDFGCKIASGYYYGGTLSKDVTIVMSSTKIAWWTISEEKKTLGLKGDSCSSLTNFEGYNDCNSSGLHPSPAVLEAGCKWKEGVNMNNTERILNIW